ncbi:uncharacterized protein LOC133191207 [Saccostrea echinata]|uniref:uncharacterized protein LOC133191207 n=1 Tax=Saccostrea echinata TaxID=191078 RepID=UPI002A81D326|nr:uncharacterized protein LOC133191207 [Saccostrea echinata]
MFMRTAVRDRIFLRSEVCVSVVTKQSVSGRVPIQTTRLKVMKSCLLCLLAVGWFVHYTTADLPKCRGLKSANHNRAYCYEVATYMDCTETCTELLLADQYVTADCPWGNYAHVITAAMDNHCQGIITLDKCEMFCSKTPTAATNRVVGWNCCKSCVEVCGRVPSRDVNFEDRYPGLYPRVP